MDFVSAVCVLGAVLFLIDFDTVSIGGKLFLWCGSLSLYITSRCRTCCASCCIPVDDGGDLYITRKALLGPQVALQPFVAFEIPIRIKPIIEIMPAGPKFTPVRRGEVESLVCCE